MEPWFYGVEIAIGNPPQNILVKVDTASSDLWVNSKCSSWTSSPSQEETCKQVPRYDPDSSRSGKGPIDSIVLDYRIPYGHMLNLDIYKDTVTIGDLELKNQTFGVASSSEEFSIGHMGLGPVTDRSIAVYESYYPLLDSLAEQKVIASRAYSLGIPTGVDEYGSLIFGGLDKGRFSGNLTKTPIVESRIGGARLTVNVSSVGASADGTNKEYILKDTNFVLHSGNTIPRLNWDLVHQMWGDAGLYRGGDIWIDCDIRNNPGGITFGFGDDNVITVPFREFVYALPQSDEGAQEKCVVAVEGVDEGEQQVLGGSFFRAAYVVVDVDNKNVHIAEAANCTSEIVPIGSGEDAVPSVTGNCRAD
ncbi:hypothetical protein ACHAPJ_008835 [Fusarium lateritium]